MSADARRWKDYLLKSSLPLEHVVRKKLELAGFHGLGAFSYLRSNEHGNRAEFSVDLLGLNLLKRKNRFWSALEVLIECKYNYPGVRWVFSPHAKTSFVILGCISYLDDLTTEHIKDHRELYRLDNKLLHCARGVELHSSGFDSNSIERGLSQLRYALPNLVAMRCSDQVNTWHEEDLYIQFIVPILVTTAQLFVLKQQIDIDTVHSANDLAEIAEEVPALIHYQSQTPDLEYYAGQIARQLYDRFPEVVTRLEEIDAICKINESKALPITSKIDHKFEFVAQDILVVQLESLDNVLADICRGVRSVGSKLERVARLEVDLKSHTKRFVPP
jgi:hypothetical protein